MLGRKKKADKLQEPQDAQKEIVEEAKSTPLPEEDVQQDAERVATNPVATDEPPTPTGSPAPSFPTFEGAKVVEILEENVNGRWHHCRMDDGTSRHVPIELFK